MELQTTNAILNSSKGLLNQSEVKSVHTMETVHGHLVTVLWQSEAMAKNGCGVNKTAFFAEDILTPEESAAIDKDVDDMFSLTYRDSIVSQAKQISSENPFANFVL